MSDARPSNRFAFKPKDEGPCLCGSGAVFSACCKGQLPVASIGEKMLAAWREGDWAAAIHAVRADIAQYTIWHKSHTAPGLAREVAGVADLLSLDIAALSEQLASLCIFYHRLDRSAELPAMLERLRVNIRSPLWDRKITYYQALIAHQQDDDVRARVEFDKLLPIEDAEPDIEIIQLYIPLYGPEISFSRMIALSNRVIALTKSVEDRIQYAGLKGFMYITVGDNDAARGAFTEAVLSGRSALEKKPLGDRAKQLLAGALVNLGILTENQQKIEEAAGIFRDLLADQETWTPAGRALLYEELGECHRFAGEWREGENAYLSALAAAPRGIASVFLAECVLRQGRIGEAAKLLDGVDLAALDEREKFDHACLAAAIAAESKEKPRLEAAIALLKVVKTDAPYFEQRRLNLLLNLKDALTDTLKAGTGLAAIGRLLSAPLRAFDRYAIVQPTVFGVGLDLKAMIQDARNVPRDKDEK